MPCVFKKWGVSSGMKLRVWGGGQWEIKVQVKVCQTEGCV